MAYSKAEIKKRYDKIRKMVKEGKISAKEAAKLGRGMSKDYFSEGNKAQRNKDAMKAKPAPKAKPTPKAKPAPTSGKSPVLKSMYQKGKTYGEDSTRGKSPVKKNLYPKGKMVGEDVKPTEKGASPTRVTGSNVSKSKPKKEKPKYNRRGRRI